MFGSYIGEYIDNSKMKDIKFRIVVEIARLFVYFFFFLMYSLLTSFSY